jgi:hypothetical protein
MFDYSRLSEELLRSLRGRRSQAASSRRLGYRSNVVYRWETGRAAPLSSVAFRAMRFYGVDLDAAHLEFMRLTRAEPQARPFEPWRTKQSIAAFLEHLRGRRTLLEVEAQSSFNRFSLSRWFNGRAEPRLPEFFELVDVLSGRLLDLIAALCEPERLPCIKDDWVRHVALRDAAFDAPWSHAVLRVLELADYRELPQHEPGWIAQRLRISQREEQRCLELLSRSGQIRQTGSRYEVTSESTVDLGDDPERARQLRRFWLDETLRRFDERNRGIYGYNLFSVSEDAYDQIRQLYLEFFAAMRKVVAQSEAGRRVVLFGGQLVWLDGGVRDE